MYVDEFKTKEKQKLKEIKNYFTGFLLWYYHRAWVTFACSNDLSQAQHYFVWHLILTKMPYVMNEFYWLF